MSSPPFNSTRVLIVDDSVVFRSQIRAALENIEGIAVVGVAANGRIALEKLTREAVDVVVLDLEMPELNGLETLREMKLRSIPAKVVVFASLNRQSADVAMEALTHGASDVITKPAGGSGSLEEALRDICAELVPKIRQFAKVRPPEASGASVPEVLPSAPSASVVSFPRRDLSHFRPSAIAIGSSTGGPDALERVFTNFGAPAQCPIFLVQHMPPVFTASLAERLSRLSGMPAAEAKHLEQVRPGHIYMAPGGYHMRLQRDKQGVVLLLDQGPKEQSVRPAVDPLFVSLAEVYGADCAGFILTGMGEDGLRGATALKRAGAGIMIQSAESCVVFGMPGAVYRAGLADGIGDLQAIRVLLQRMTSGAVGQSFPARAS